MNELQENNPKKDLDRLKTLYSISKRLSVFTSVAESFADILDSASESFPILSAVLIEHWEDTPQTTVWFSETATQEMITKATLNAKKSYSFFSGATAGEAADLINAVTPENKLFGNDKTMLFTKEEDSHCIAIPLAIDYLPPLGILQLEGSGYLNEEDLKFVSALANLVAVALDRYYKSKFAREFREKEAKTNLNMLYGAQSKVEDLESERELREAFVSLLTHDLRTPLTVILGSAQMILRRPSDLETTKKSALIIVVHANRAGQMITDLLDANRLRSGQGLSLIKAKIDIAELIQNTLSELSIIHGNRFIFKDTQETQCLVDARGVRRIIENLCNNAIKYGSPTTPVVLGLKHTANDITMTVCNEGNVISSEDQKSLFQQFRRSEAASLSNIQGWGIGLALVRGVAEAHGGSVAVSSDFKNGTVFTVVLPRGL